LAPPQALGRQALSARALPKGRAPQQVVVLRGRFIGWRSRDNSPRIGRCLYGDNKWQTGEPPRTGKTHAPRLQDAGAFR
jgi:hypothetical protein